MRTIVFVTVFVIRPAAAGWEFLQILRAPGRYMEGTWQLVAGGIEDGESAWQAAIRELREETGLAPLEFYHLDIVNTFYLPHLDSLNHSIHLCAVVGKHATVVLNHEHLEFRWIAQNKIEPLLMWAGQKQGCRRVIQEIINNGPTKPYCRIQIPHTSTT